MRAIGHYRPISTTSTHTKLNNGGIHMLSTIKRAIKGIVSEFKAGYNAQRTSMTTTPTTTMPITGVNYEALITTMLREHNLSTDLYIKEGALANMVMCVIGKEDLHVFNLDMEIRTNTLLVVDPTAVSQYHLSLSSHDPIFKALTIADMATIIAAHELGHIKGNHTGSEDHAWKKAFIGTGATVATHRADCMKMGQITINEEFEAWSIGKAYVPTHLSHAYDTFNRFNVNNYKSTFNELLGTNTFR